MSLQSAKRPSSMTPSLMRLAVASILASLLPFTGGILVVPSSSSSSSSSLLSSTGDLAPSLLSFTLLTLVAAGGTGVATAANYSASQLQAMMFPGSQRGSANDGVLTQLGLMNAPSPRHLNPEQLRTRLGASFDADWMSIDRPSSQGTGTGAGTPTGTGADVDDELAEELRELSFSYTDEHGDRRTMPTAVRSIVERWLLQRASCPVRYTWEDMGEYFWPRWVKHGHCDSNKPCSWPNRMHCTAAESDTLRLLNWQCRRPPSNRKVRHAGHHHRRQRRAAAATRGGATQRPQQGSEAKNKKVPGGKTRCQWRKVPYPVTSECFCSC